MYRQKRVTQSDKVDGFEFSVFSWNVLCQSKAYDDAFPYTDKRYLEREHRTNLIRQELDNNFADVMILVDLWADSGIEEHLGDLGYNVYTFFEHGRGIAMALSTEKFPDTPGFREYREGGNHVVTMLLEAPETPHQRVHVSAVHLIPGTSPQTEYWRSLAMSQLLSHMHQHPYPYVVAGDFNSTEDYGTIFARPVSDVYIDESGRGPEWTSWRVTDSEHLAVTSRILCSQLDCYSTSIIPDRESLVAEGEQARALPSAIYPSHHISLCANFLI